VWSINCFYIDRRHRGAGVAGALLAGAVAHARERGATQVEGYPIHQASEARASADLYTGTLEMFERAGFREVARRGGRPIVRRSLRPLRVGRRRAGTAR
jgi:GNAT superfamily N-acetyltransferase